MITLPQLSLLALKESEGVIGLGPWPPIAVERWPSTQTRAFIEVGAALQRGESNGDDRRGKEKQQAPHEVASTPTAKRRDHRPSRQPLGGQQRRTTRTVLTPTMNFVMVSSSRAAPSRYSLPFPTEAIEAVCCYPGGAPPPRRSPPPTSELPSEIDIPHRRRDIGVVRNVAWSSSSNSTTALISRRPVTSPVADGGISILERRRMERRQRAAEQAMRKVAFIGHQVVLLRGAPKITTSGNAARAYASMRNGGGTAAPTRAPTRRRRAKTVKR